MEEKSLSRADYEYIHTVTHKFLDFWEQSSAFTIFPHTEDKLFAGMSIRESLFLDHFEGYDLRDMVTFRFPKIIPLRRKWPYKTSRKKFLEFIDKLAKE